MAEKEADESQRSKGDTSSNSAATNQAPGYPRSSTSSPEHRVGQAAQTTSDVRRPRTGKISESNNSIPGRNKPKMAASRNGGALPGQASQTYLRCIRRQDPQALPVRLLRNDLIDQAQQSVLSGSKRLATRWLRAFEKALAGSPDKGGSSGKQGKEGIKLRLNCAANAGEQESDQIREWQFTVSGEKPRLAAGGGTEIGAMNVVR